MDLDNLRAFLSVAKYGSFLVAANASGLARTRLRRQVERLETDLGVRLLHREARGVRPTEAGARLLRRGPQLLADAAIAIAEARGGDGRRTTLRLIVPVGVPTALRVRALAQLADLTPEIGVDVVELESPRNQLGTPFDLMIHFGAAPPLDGWYSHRVLRLELRLFASPAYLAEAGLPTELEALGAHRLLSWRTDGCSATAWPLRHGGDLAVVPALASANLELVAGFAAGGGGIALLPTAAPLLYPDAAPLEPVLPELVGGSLDARALSPHPSRADPRLRALLENVHSLLGAAGASPPPGRP